MTRLGQAVDYRDFDDVIVDRIVAGGRVGVPISAANAAEATRRLTRSGYSDGQVAHLLGYHRRSVQRIRERRGIPASLPVGSNHITRPVDAPTRPRRAG